MRAGINNIFTRDILDSRGNPTIQVSVTAGEYTGIFEVPSGASTGSHEALELRDGDKNSFSGKGVKKAMQNITDIIAPALTGMDAADQIAIDKRLLELDGTENKSKLGGNAITGVSVAVAKAAAGAQNIPVHKWISQLSSGITSSRRIPYICMNLTNGGMHASGRLAFQEYKVIPKTDDIREALNIGTSIMHGLKKCYSSTYGAASANVGDEGGFAPDIQDIRAPLDMLMQTAAELGLDNKIALALDVAASSFYSEKDNSYTFNGGHNTPSQLEETLRGIIRDFPILYIEDPFHENAIADFARLNTDAGVTIVGDDLTVTNPIFLQKAIDAKAISGIIIKINQVGTLTEALDCMRLARANGIECIVSHRSGETNDTFVADLAFGTGAFGIKAGGPQRGERVAKYNRLLEITSSL